MLAPNMYRAPVQYEHRMRVWLLHDCIVGGVRMSAGAEAMVERLEALRLLDEGNVYLPDDIDAKMLMPEPRRGGYETK